MLVDMPELQAEQYLQSCGRKDPSLDRMMAGPLARGQA
jgi:hypothetical protein